MRRRYRVSINFRPSSLQIIQQANDIAEKNLREGFSLTLRQLYYRFVAAGLIPNKQTEYKRLGSIINDARYAGLFDWSLITDRTRNASGGDYGNTPGHPEETIDPRYYSVTQWDGQPNRVEVWVEKDALIDVIQKAASGLRATTFSCRGYTSSSEIWAAAQRLEQHLLTPGIEKVTILHLGDHDPSGIDMTRDITDRVREFVAGDMGFHEAYERLIVKRIALNMDQVQQYDPPPNPAKDTDSRFAGYVDLYGDESWELDALEPRVLVDLIRSEIKPLIDAEKWAERQKITAEGRVTLQAVSDHYEDIIDFLRERGDLPEAEIEDDLGDDETT
jgi:hypothetical protein